eukprot:5953721-Amphidinium_carterae.1
MSCKKESVSYKQGVDLRMYLVVNLLSWPVPFAGSKPKSVLPPLKTVACFSFPLFDSSLVSIFWLGVDFLRGLIVVYVPSRSVLVIESALFIWGADMCMRNELRSHELRNSKELSYGFVLKACIVPEVAKLSMFSRMLSWSDHLKACEVASDVVWYHCSVV